MSEKDIFYLEKVFPEPSQIFAFSFKDISEISKNCVYVLDTNVLFVPFNTSEKNLDDIKNIFLKLKSTNRLFLPARVVREFANNRAARLGNLFLKIRQTKDSLNIGNFKIDDYPLLNNNEFYIAAKNNFDQITKLIKESRKLFEQVESDILAWNWDDNVSKAYKDIFTSDLIKEVKKGEEELISDLNFRIKFKVAPGYKDSNKPDDGIGDLVIWQTAMEIAKEQGKDLIFVSNDQKNDWFYKQDKEGLYPKYELFDEFRRFTNGSSMQIINFPKFLELLNAKQETIEEVRESIERVENDDFKKGYNANNLVTGLKIEHRKFGIGTILNIYKSGNDNDWFEVNFENFGVKKLLIKFTPMKILSNAHNFWLLNPNFDGDPKTYQLLDIQGEDY